MKIFKQTQVGQVSLPMIVIVAAVALGAGFFLNNILSAKSDKIHSAKPFNCYLSSKRPCYEKQISYKVVEMGSVAGEKAFSACAKDTPNYQGIARGTSEKCNQKLYQFNIPYNEEIKYCSSHSSTLKKYEGNCIPPIIIPNVWALNPESGPIGTRVTISGSGFTPTDNYLMLMTHPLGYTYIPTPFTSSDGYRITFTIPSTVSLLTSCSPLNMGTSAYCNGEPLKEVAITPGEYKIVVFNTNGVAVKTELGDGIYSASEGFIVTATQ